MYEVYLKKGEERRILSGHAWVYANEVQEIKGKDKNGSLATVFTHDKKYIGKGCKDIEKLKVVLGRISKLIVAELNDEPFSRELLSCVKVYLWRHVKYDSHLRVAQNVINNSLSKK